MSYPLATKYGLKVAYVKDEVYRDNAEYMIQASEVEKLLSEGIEVFGDEQSKEDFCFQKDRLPQDISTALLIGIKPIEKEQPVSIKEVTEKLEDVLALMNVDGAFKKDTESLITRLKATKELK